MGKKILLVDDEQDWVKMLTVRLEHEGYQVEAALDALEAVTQARESKPDLILLDIMMPACDGIETLKHFRQNTNTYITPVIVITARGDKETKEAAEKLGISGYFTKPVEMGALLEKLKEELLKQ